MSNCTKLDGYFKKLVEIHNSYCQSIPERFGDIIKLYQQPIDGCAFVSHPVTISNFIIDDFSPNFAVGVKAMGLNQELFQKVIPKDSGFRLFANFQGAEFSFFTKSDTTVHRTHQGDYIAEFYFHAPVNIRTSKLAIFFNEKVSENLFLEPIKSSFADWGIELNSEKEKEYFLRFDPIKYSYAGAKNGYDVLKNFLFQSPWDDFKYQGGAFVRLRSILAQLQQSINRQIIQN